MGLNRQEHDGIGVDGYLTGRKRMHVEAHLFDWVLENKPAALHGLQMPTPSNEATSAPAWCGRPPSTPPIAPAPYTMNRMARC